MIVVVAPEPAPWLSPLLDALRGGGDALVFAPWALRPAGRLVLPKSARRFLDRRRLGDGDRCTSRQPFWLAAEAAARGWSRGRTDRSMRARFALREATDWMAARWLPAGVHLVFAPALSARRLFAVARKRGASCLLIEDLPSFRELHDDLDRAALAWPGRPFLHRYRASASWVAHQEAERQLADRLLVRGRFAREQREALGYTRVLDLPWPRVAPATDKDRATRRATQAPALLLAGLGAARNGAVETLALARARPGLTLLVRPGEGVEPDLLIQPNVRPATTDQHQHLSGVDAVLAPAWCEAYPGEVALAAALGVPIVATRRALGFVGDAAAARVHEIAPGDITALIASVDAVAPDVTSRRRARRLDQR